MVDYPIVVYGVSLFKGMKIMELLTGHNIPFTSMEHNANRTHEIMAQRGVGQVSSTHELTESPHEVETLFSVYQDAKVGSNTTDPFINFGRIAVKAVPSQLSTSTPAEDWLSFFSCEGSTTTM